MALLPAVVGGFASVFCYSWTKTSRQYFDKDPLSFNALIAIFSSFIIVFVCSITTINSFLGVGSPALEIITPHPYLYLILIPIIVLLPMINDDSEALLLRVLNGCLVAFGLAVALGTVSFYALNQDPSLIGIRFAFSLVLMLHSSFLYICLVIWTMLSKQLRPNMFALKNWHLAEMFTFWIFAIMSPPSLWEVISEEGEQVKQMEVRISELEDRLATLSI